MAPAQPTGTAAQLPLPQTIVQEPTTKPKPKSHKKSPDANELAPSFIDGDNYMLDSTKNDRLKRYMGVIRNEVNSTVVKAIGKLAPKLKETYTRQRENIANIIMLHWFINSKYNEKQGTISSNMLIKDISETLKLIPDGIKALSLTEIQLLSVPYEALGFFSNLGALSLNGCGLSKVEEISGLSGLPCLKTLYLNDNKFNQIPDLTNFKAITELSMLRNPLMNVVPTDVKLGTKVKKVLLAQNGYFTAEQLQKLKDLNRSVDISGVSMNN